MNILPQEIVGEILVRLPIMPLFRFKCVSKQWESMISDPKFGLDYVQKAKSWSSSRLWTMLYPYVNCDRDRLPDNVRNLVGILSSTDPDAPLPISFASLPTAELNNESGHEVMCSSNGLILSSLRGKSLLYVSNPLTKQCAALPKPACRDPEFVLGLATRFAAHSMTYKVVLFNFNARVEIFSSDTGRWDALNLKRRGEVVIEGAEAGEPCSYKGVLHWMDRTQSAIITYDPYDSPDRFGRIRLPQSEAGMDLRGSGMNLIHSGGDEVLEYADLEYCTGGAVRVCVWRLVDCRKGEWRLRSRCGIDGFWDRCWLTNCGRPVASDPWNRGRLLCYTYPIDGHWVVTLDVGTGKRKFVDPIGDGRVETDPESFCLPKQLVPLALSPWASPFYTQDT